MSEWMLQPKKEGEVIRLGESAAESVLKQWRNNANAELRDAKGHLKEIANKNDYRLIPVRERESNLGDKWICNYGTHHKSNVGLYVEENSGTKQWSGKECECKKKFGVFWLKFLKWCQKNYKYVECTSNIKEHMQDEFLRLQSLQQKGKKAS